VAVGVLIGSADAGATNNASVPASAEPPTQAAPAPAATAQQPAAPPESTPAIFNLGETFTTGTVTLTVHSIEAVSEVATTYGSPIVPDPGGQLFLIRTTYSNSKSQADLACGDSHLYIQVFDTEEREMAPNFDKDRIPGNPECNDHLLQDTPQEWNFALQSVAGAVPLAMSVTETDSWLDPVWIDLQ